MIVRRLSDNLFFFYLFTVVTLLSKLFEKFSNRMATWKRKTVPVDICHRMEIFDRQSLLNSNSFLQMHLLDNLHLMVCFKSMIWGPWTRTARKLTQIVLSKCQQLYFWKYFLQINWNWFSFNIILLPMFQSNYERVPDVSLNINNSEHKIIQQLTVE